MPRMHIDGQASSGLTDSTRISTTSRELIQRLTSSNTGILRCSLGQLAVFTTLVSRSGHIGIPK
jgi:hypothetical protein